MNFKDWIIKESDLHQRYGGPAFNWESFWNEYQNNDFIRSKQLYEDADLELSNLNSEIRKEFKVNYKDLIWFRTYLDPVKYSSGITVQNSWQDDYKSGVDNFKSLIEWLEWKEGEPFEQSDLIGYDRSNMNCIKKVMQDFDFQNIRDDEWNYNWGPFEWQPEHGEWERCRRIALDHEEYPVTVLVNGKMIDGAHRLAVALFKRRSSYPCLVGVPEHWFESK